MHGPLPWLGPLYASIAPSGTSRNPARGERRHNMFIVKMPQFPEK